MTCKDCRLLLSMDLATVSPAVRLLVVAHIRPPRSQTPSRRHHPRSRLQRRRLHRPRCRRRPPRLPILPHPLRSLGQRRSRTRRRPLIPIGVSSSRTCHYNSPCTTLQSYIRLHCFNPFVYTLEKP